MMHLSSEMISQVCKEPSSKKPGWTALSYINATWGRGMRDDRRPDCSSVKTNHYRNTCRRVRLQAAD